MTVSWSNSFTDRYFIGGGRGPVEKLPVAANSQNPTGEVYPSKALLLQYQLQAGEGTQVTFLSVCGKTRTVLYSYNDAGSNCSTIYQLQIVGSECCPT